MDYKYIEQLLERYFQCATSLEEEQILRSFFLQKDIPAELLPYRDLFVYEHCAKEEKLSNDFDAKILAIVEKPTVKARHISIASRLKPFYRAAAAVAILLTIGNAAQHSFTTKENVTDYNYDSYTDTYSDPAAAYKQVTTALEMVSEGINKAQKEVVADSIDTATTDATEKITE